VRLHATALCADPQCLLVLCVQLLVPPLENRKAPLCLSLHCKDLAEETRDRLRALNSGMRIVSFNSFRETSPKEDYAQDTLFFAWSAAALAISFVRAHAGHPFARSVVPLIPSVLTLSEGKLNGTDGFDKKPSALLSTAFARSHFRLGRAAGGVHTCNTATHRSDSDSDAVMAPAAASRKRAR
jgi:hypothetical protein